MFSRKWLRAACLPFALAWPNVAPNVAGAQTVGADSTLDQRLRRDTPLVSSLVEAPPSVLTGREDVVLLERRDLFDVHVDLDAQYTDNLGLTAEDALEGYVASYIAGAGASVQLARRVDVRASVDVAGARYDGAEALDLDYDAALATVGASGEVAYGVVASAQVQAVKVFDQDFGTERLTQTRVVAALSKSFEIPSARTRITPVVSYEMASSDPDVYDREGWSAAVQADWSPAPQWQVTARVGYAERTYENYFPGIVGVEREDQETSVALAVTRAIGDRFAVRLQASSVENDSTSDVNAFQANGGGVGLSFVTRF